jgi:hypothetical protein
VVKAEAGAAAVKAEPKEEAAAPPEARARVKAEVKEEPGVKAEAEDEAAASQAAAVKLEAGGGGGGREGMGWRGQTSRARPLAQAAGSVWVPWRQ